VKGVLMQLPPLFQWVWNLFRSLADFVAGSCRTVTRDQKRLLRGQKDLDELVEAVVVRGASLFAGPRTANCLNLELEAQGLPYVVTPNSFILEGFLYAVDLKAWKTYKEL
jgi:hypothetical protein